MGFRIFAGLVTLTFYGCMTVEYSPGATVGTQSECPFGGNDSVIVEKCSHYLYLSTTIFTISPYSYPAVQNRMLRH
jgi:hypothetical protein